MRFSRMTGLILFTAFLGLSEAAAQERNPRVTFSGGGSFLQGDRTFIVDGEPFRSQFVDGGKFGFRGTVDLNHHWALEGAYSFGRNNLRITELDEVPPEERGFGVRLHQFTGNVLYFFNPQEDRLRPFVTAGLGGSRYSPTTGARTRALLDEFLDDPTVLRSSTKFTYSFGGGVEARLHRWLGTRLDFRDVITKHPRFRLPETPSGPGAVFYPVDGAVHDLEVAVGVVFYFR